MGVHNKRPRNKLMTQFPGLVLENGSICAVTTQIYSSCIRKDRDTRSGSGEFLFQNIIRHV